MTVRKTNIRSNHLEVFKKDMWLLMDKYNCLTRIGDRSLSSLWYGLPEKPPNEYDNADRKIEKNFNTMEETFNHRPKKIMEKIERVIINGTRQMHNHKEDDPDPDDGTVMII